MRGGQGQPNQEGPWAYLLRGGGPHVGEEGPFNWEMVGPTGGSLGAEAVGNAEIVISKIKCVGCGPIF